MNWVVAGRKIEATSAVGFAIAAVANTGAATAV